MEVKVRLRTERLKHRGKARRAVHTWLFVAGEKAKVVVGQWQDAWKEARVSLQSTLHIVKKNIDLILRAMGRY